MIIYFRCSRVGVRMVAVWDSFDFYHRFLRVSGNLGGSSLGVHIIRIMYFAVHSGLPDSWKLPPVCCLCSGTAIMP